MDIDSLQLPPILSKVPDKIELGDVISSPNKDLILSETLIKTAKDDPKIEKKLKALENSEREAQKSREKVDKLQKDQENLMKKYPLSKNDRDKLNKIEKETKIELKKITDIKETQDSFVKDLNSIHNSNLAKKSNKVEIDPSWYHLPGDSEAIRAIKKDIEIMNNIVGNNPELSESPGGFKEIRDNLAKKLEIELKKEINNK